MPDSPFSAGGGGRFDPHLIRMEKEFGPPLLDWVAIDMYYTGEHTGDG